MASSQVEISSSSSPFRCVLRSDRNRRESNVTASHVARFRTNLKTLVMDRLNDCISITPPDHNHNLLVSKTTTNPLHQTSSTLTIDHPHNTSTTNDPQAATSDDKETSKLGASSLVQIWEKRLSVSGVNTTSCPGKQVVELMNTEQEQEQACAATDHLEDERTYDAGPGSEDGFADWHLSTSPPSSTQSQRSSDVGEKERVCVVDIIRRLTLTAAKPPHSTSVVEDNEHHSNESVLILKDQVEPKCLAHILCSPRIRGRQAFADLLLQIERDRQRELHILLNRRAVSKFTQRGRIQSLLRLKIMKRGMALEDEQHRPPFVITPRQNHKSSTIMHLRERFSRVGENGARSPLGEMLNNGDDDKAQSDTDTHLTNTNDDDDKHQSDIDTLATNTNDNDNDNQQVVGIHSSTYTVANPKDVEEQIEEQVELYPPSSNLNLESQDSSNGWEDSETAEESYVGMGISSDWFTDISRPRSYWEDRRQTWYQQMLDCNAASDEIRQLIQRKTVSNFLSSDFRERMDKLMVSRLEGRQTQQREEFGDGTEEGLWCFSSEERTQPKSSDNEEDERSSAQDHEANGYLDHLQLGASPSILSSWSYQDNEMGEDSNGGASTSSPQPCPPQFSSNNNQPSFVVSTSHNPSIEMELIYDLRGNMEQMYREMSELRKAIKCCMDMQQLMLQQSMKHEVVAGEGRRKPNKVNKSRKRKCCICFDMEIDSLLYRCGHMCSCMKCGKELQWRGGKCPVCGAPIEDVVRASFTTHSS